LHFFHKYAVSLQKNDYLCTQIEFNTILLNTFMNFTLLITVLLTAITLVVAAYVVAKLIGPRSYAKVKGEPYESGIPTRGSSWLPMSVGFYLFAILFLMFDIETVFLYPWAVVVKEFGAMALLSIGFFLVVLVLGLAYAWRKGDLEWK
jgi:NADH-quinone oxidoreductase subunit A